MQNSVLLRFRDYGVDTIGEHLAIIRRAKYVWWGWWKKDDEPKRGDELLVLHDLLRSSKSLEIGLFDRSTQRCYLARAVDCLFALSGDRIRSPDFNATPTYYNDALAPAWFKLTSIKKTNVANVSKKFGDIPGGEATFFSLVGGRVSDSDESVPVAEPIAVDQPAILHISDVHFGSDFGFPLKPGPGQKTLLDIILRDVKATAPLGVGMLILSGDLSSRGDSNVLFDPGVPFLKGLAERLDLDIEQVVVIPGNHDIPLDNYSLVTYLHEASYRAFLKELYGKPSEMLGLKSFRLADGRVLEILSINSVRLRSPNLGYRPDCCKNML